MKYNYNGIEININKKMLQSINNFGVHSIDFLEECKKYCMRYYNRKWAKQCLKKINKELWGVK